MQISYNWLKNFVNITETPEEIGKYLTSIGLEVESIEAFEQVQGGLRGIVIGEVITCEKHPNADKLSKTTVNIGNDNGLSPIVCGAPNVRAGQKVLVATVGATLYPTTGESFTIKKAKIRGEESEGMICAEDELGLGESHDGIMVLQTDLPNGTPASAYFGFETDYIFTIGLTPNRTDAMSHLGVARDLAAKLNLACKYVESPKITKTSDALNIKVSVENSLACPRYTGVTIAGVKVQDSPEWLQIRLKSIGAKPINNIVDITNFVLHEFGQPLHAFDADKIAGKQILVKNLPQDTPFVSLEGTTRKLSAQDLMICDGESNPMCIGGVFGGLESGVSSSTQNIFLESAHFLPASIRKSKQYHNLHTDASFRFERGVSPATPLVALERAVSLILTIAGGQVSSEVTDIYPTPILPAQVQMKWRNIDRLIGKELDRFWVKGLLQRLDIQVSNETETGFLATIPQYRVDVTREADVIEEIARHYGYDNLELSERLGTAYLAEFPQPDASVLQFQITQLLAGSGFSEILTNSLTKPTYTEGMAQYPAENYVQILNKLSEELGVMRQSLLFSGLEVIAHNVNRKQKDLKLFEFGKVYRVNLPPSPSKLEGVNTTLQSKVDTPPLQNGEGAGGEVDSLSKYSERLQLSIFISGNQHAETWHGKAREADYFDLASAVQKVLQRMGFADLKGERVQTDTLSDAIVYKRGKQVIATVGAVQQNVLKKAHLKQGVWYAELEWESILKSYKQNFGFKEISKFPEVHRDLSLVLDNAVSFAQIRDLAFQKERKLLKSVNVFDVFQGESLGAGKKAYAVRFVLEDNTQTLTDQAIDQVMQKLMQSYEKDLGAVIRK
jgi:phenylalanyl-tRNA synthetase beta chain